MTQQALSEPSLLASVGRVMGNYRLLRPLGYGGMGQVFLAEHVVLGRLAAVKVILPELSQQHEALARFFNEARASAALRHPGLIEVFDFGWEPSGSAFIVMELLEGTSLRELIERSLRLPTAFALGIIRQAAEAMALVHAHGIIHRDLKPENLFLVPDAEIPSGWRVKVLDFGIAKLFGSWKLNEPVTRSGHILGTPAYMAPEQCHGAGHIDLRADIYSLGCILFEMLCGRPPFISDGVGAIIAAHLLQPAPVPSELADVPPELDQLIQSMLCKSPDERIPSMPALLARLGELPVAVETAAEVQAWSITLACGSGAKPLPLPPIEARLRGPLPLPAQTTRPLHFDPSHQLRTPALFAQPLPRPRSPSLPVESTEELQAIPRNAWPGRFAGVVGVAAAAAAALWVLTGQPMASLGGNPPAAAPAALATAGAPAASARPTPIAASVPTVAARSLAGPAQQAAPHVEAEAALPPTVTWHIESRPVDARVIRVDDGAELGRTPLELRLPATSGRLSVTIVKPGYRATQADLPLDRDASAIVELSQSVRRDPSPSAKRRRPSGPIADGTLDPYGD